MERWRLWEQDKEQDQSIKTNKQTGMKQASGGRSHTGRHKKLRKHKKEKELEIESSTPSLDTDEALAEVARGIRHVLYFDKGNSSFSCQLRRLGHLDGMLAIFDVLP